MSDKTTLSLLNSQDRQTATALAQLVRTLNLTGHNPATSGNYSFRCASMPGFSLVSESGIDKAGFTENNFLLIDQQNGIIHPASPDKGRKSSDETALHLAVYRATSAECVLHSHLLESILFADLFPEEKLIFVEGLELLKGFKGITSHRARVGIPTFDNTQDIAALALEVEQILSQQQAYGILLRGHGLYVWGESILGAKRHLEVFEYIFKYYIQTHRRF